MSTPEVFIVSAARTAIGSFGGSLKDVALSQLASTTVGAALQRSGCAPERVGHVVLGNVIPTEPGDAYLARVAALNAGLSKETPAFNVNRLCGSGLQAVISAAQSLLLGETEVAIAGGAEVILLDEPTAGMSRSESDHAVELIRKVTVGKTLVMVEHDMSVVFGLADRISVLVYGEVIATDTPQAIRSNRKVKEAYLGTTLDEDTTEGVH